VSNRERQADRLTILLLVDRRTSVLKRYLVENGFRVVESYTTDRAVAICVNNSIDAAVIDQDCFVETDGWSVAQSLKAVKSNLRVVLVSPATMVRTTLPQGIDAMVSANNPEAVLAEIRRLLWQSHAKNSRLG
jgi:DNA-binding response OmpR family regulator